MASEELNREVAALEHEVATMREQLDALVAASRTDIASQAAVWIDGEIARKVDENPAAIQALGAERVRALKAKIAEVRSATAATVQRGTEQAAKWPHRTVPDPDDYRTPSTEPYFTAVFRAAISELGPVLDEFGLLSSPKGHVNSWERVPGGKIRYAINPGFAPRTSTALTQYFSLLTKYREAEKQLVAKRSALEKAKARELWESA